MRQGQGLLTDTGRWLPLLCVAGKHVHDVSCAGEGRLEEERLDVPTSHLRDAHISCWSCQDARTAQGCKGRLLRPGLESRGVGS